MRLLSLLRTQAFRIALVYVAMFAISVFAIVASSSRVVAWSKFMAGFSVVALSKFHDRFLNAARLLRATRRRR